ncbi:MAG: pyruvate dehydrogenase (acetyl-transferring), homodimeric type [Planctomycetes bacterium]|nr:pyruvate dehydrogenase (acetyl-transferring), homodimeric type [Planctomycetota bacterium]
MHSFEDYRPDIDPTQTSEWEEAFDAVVKKQGLERAHYLLDRLLRRSEVREVRLPALLQTPYINTIDAEKEPPYPGDEPMERRIRRLIRWNAVAMVMRANNRIPGLGGHLATYASAATLYEVGFHHFFRGPDAEGGGDHLFFQGHASPGIYARSYLEGRFTERQLDNFRFEIARGQGLSSYPHPWLMPDYWTFPTVSMGLGPIQAIYLARFLRYLHNRGIRDTSRQRVWAFLGDGETDEPESLGALHVAAREGLDNLIFVVNCNLQRLDGPVRGNSKIIQELEASFKGAGWHVVKVIWGREWDDLLKRDGSGMLIRRMGEVVDGQFQRYSTESGHYVRHHFFGADPRLKALVDSLSDADVERLRRGGHDVKKVYAAYRAAWDHPGAPSVILAKTVKGWALGGGAEGRNVAHQVKKMTYRELQVFRDRLELPIADKDLENPPYHRPPDNAPEIQYLKERRAALGGFIPRRVVVPFPLEVPAVADFPDFFKPVTDLKQAPSTTVALARLISDLLRHPKIGKRVVPIVPDEARTFGMEALFKKYGIYSSVGQLYESQDKDMILAYRESVDGQMLEEGLTEAGAVASFSAAAVAHAAVGEPMIPFYVFYSMFGFQRTGDQLWALGDMRGRGFLIGATAGRTTLCGEGLQHEDGHSLLLASAYPTVRAYDPAFTWELALIVQDGLRRMYVDGEDVFYYVTVYNERYLMPPMPPGAEEGVLRGIYLLREGPRPRGGKKKPRAQLIGSGSVLTEVLRAADLLEKRGVAADVWSAPSFLALRRDALECERANLLRPEAPPRVPFLAKALAGREGPFIASTDWMRAVPDQIARWAPGGLYTLGTDGFGRSASRPALRRFFEIDAECVAVAALFRLAERGEVPRSAVSAAIREFDIDPEKVNPMIG